MHTASCVAHKKQFGETDSVLLILQKWHEEADTGIYSLISLQGLLALQSLIAALLANVEKSLVDRKLGEMQIWILYLSFNTRIFFNWSLFVIYIWQNPSTSGLTKKDKIYRVAAIFPEYFRSLTVALSNHIFFSFVP